MDPQALATRSLGSLVSSRLQKRALLQSETGLLSTSIIPRIYSGSPLLLGLVPVSSLPTLLEEPLELRLSNATGLLSPLPDPHGLL